MGALVDRLRTISEPKERARAKAQAISEVDNLPVIHVGPYRVTVGALAHVGDGVRFSVVVMRGNKDVTPPDLNPITVHNPPILVPDPAGAVELPLLDDGKGNLIPRRAREDPRAALIEIITDLIRSQMP